MKDGDHTVNQFDNITQLRYCRRWLPTDNVLAYPQMPFWCMENFTEVLKLPAMALDTVVEYLLTQTKDCVINRI